MIKKTRQQIIDDGAEADRLLNTELPRFIDELEAEIWEEFKKSDPSDKAVSYTHLTLPTKA